MFPQILDLNVMMSFLMKHSVVSFCDDISMACGIFDADINPSRQFFHSSTLYSWGCKMAQAKGGISCYMTISVATVKK